MRTAPEIAALLLAGVIPNLAWLGVGLLLQRLRRSPVRDAEALAIAYLLGTGAASLAILALRALDVPIPLWALGALALVGVAARPGRTSEPGAAGSRRAANGKSTPAWIRFTDGTAAAVAVLLFAAALGPELGWDSLEYHLPIVRAWSEGPIRALPGVLDAEFRSGVDLLYLPAVAAGAADAAAAVSACFAAALAALVRAAATRRASAGAGALAGLLTLLAPLTLRGALTADVDLAVGAYGFLALLSADRWNRAGARSDLLLSALAAGFAANAKLHAAVLVPAVAILLGVGGRPPPLRALLGWGAGVAALTLPWLAKLALTTGNPLFPLFAETLGYGPTTARHLAGRRATLLQELPVGRDPLGFLRWLGFVFLGIQHSAGGLLGPLPAGLAPLASRRPTRSTFALCGVLASLLVLEFCFMRPVRFGVPLWAFAAVAAAVGGARLVRSGRLAQRAVPLLIAAVVLVQGAALLQQAAPRIAAIARPEPLRRATWPDQIALRELVAHAEPPVGISMGAALWIEKPSYNLHWERNGELFLRGSDPEHILRTLERRGVRSLVVTAEAALADRGVTGLPAIDSWLRDGRASLRLDVSPVKKRGSRVWLLVELRR